MRIRSIKPSIYPLLPFHVIRTVSLISSVIVAIILAVFISHLHAAHQKLPWTFLILLIASGLSILNYILTTLLHLRHGLSPRLSLTTTGITLAIYLISLALLSWCMYQTILTTCTATYWANAAGIAVCKTFKALFTFTVLATASQIASITLDVIVRNRQTRLGAYDPMGSNTMLDANGMKLQDRNSLMSTAGAESLGPHPSDRLNGVHDDDLYGHGVAGGMTGGVGGGQFHDHDLHGVHAPPAYGYGSGTVPVEGQQHYHDAGQAQNYYGVTGAPETTGRRQSRVRFNANDDYYGYSHPPEQTSYDAGAYHR